ncbi:MAG: hypothetical protein QW794_03995 [Thermosphaera sp.]
MKAQSVFLTCMFVLFVFNVFVWLAGLGDVVKDIIGGIIGLLIAAVIGIVLAGINILGSGLTGTSVRMLFGIATLIFILFQIPIPGFPIGLGLANNLFMTFASAGGLIGVFGFIISFVLCTLALLSGIIMLVSTGGSE